MPRTVKDLLIEIRDTTELMVDLAYSAILFDNEDIAEEVLDLENRVNDLIRQLRVVSILSARRVHDAEQISSILQIVGGAQKISEASGDIASLVMRDFKLSPEIVKEILTYAEETVAKAIVSEDSEILNKTLGESKLYTKTGMRVIAIKRGFDWIFGPDKNTKILKGDVLFARGDITGIPEFFRIVEGKYVKVEVEEYGRMVDDLEVAVGILIDMKNLSELAVDLGYSSIIYDNEDVAQEVLYLEDEIDDLKFELQRWVLESSKHVDKENFRTLIAILEIAYSSEVIADAAKEIAEIITKKLEIHPIFRDAILEGDEAIIMVEVKEGSELHEKSLGEAKVETNTGMHIIAIKRGKKWITRPTAQTKILAGDVLIAKGPKEREENLKSLCTALQQV